MKSTIYSLAINSDKMVEINKIIASCQFILHIRFQMAKIATATKKIF